MAQAHKIAAGKAIRLLGIAVMSVMLAGCSWFSSKEVDPIFSDMPMGPDSQSIKKQFPDGLPGDRDNSRHMRTSDAQPALHPIPEAAPQ
ncbi:hypothetical protein JCM17846_17090 [Iodidimonas nitroreducens]|uniref:Lipoprotein n=1 Tax=Iodidimonas nitroreducens TaxID=1236968 RepID=A0A5A7N7T5_9PROT|nr:hypothetical protein [Iodidimonas nitroreducens]GAK34486.1 hypothetical protein AQ1_02385 [alpha proteobacterium Q-1]GER04027.1 hypothetical protein JCM17846_17090 [Iodidimonas nitroreducens]